MFYKYIIRFADSEEKVIDIQLDSKSLTLIPSGDLEAPEWARLDFCKCTICPLSSASNKYCPIALNISGVTRMFADRTSVTPVEVRVETEQREYHKKTSLQNALSSLIGIYMSTSGCPVMEPLRPMARHHLPFASVEETAFRSVSTYLLQQYHKHRKGEKPDWDLELLRKAYKDIESLNQGITDRVRSASRKDANYNAVIILDAFAKMVPFTIERGLPQ
ncbi:MAG: hypothetical protein M0025_05255 [Elusimicrobia bacterium]|nr:hypothetical protein [Elusimicrobiota bacterium]